MTDANYKQHCTKLLQILDANWPQGLPTTWAKWADAARADLADEPAVAAPTVMEIIELSEEI